MDVGILVFEDAEELDFAGPWEVLGTWGALVLAAAGLRREIQYDPEPPV